jgi:predicted  nucleic acid-binding Zn-ribbon protein
MLKCKKCTGKMFLDRAFSEENHLETFCIRCGTRKFYINFDKKNGEAAWLWQMEKARMSRSISL